MERIKKEGGSEAGGRRGGEGARAWIVGLLLVAITLALFGQLASHGFINLDDDKYVTENPFVKAGLTVEGIRWAFTTTHAANWHPLTWLSHMLDVRLFGLNPGPHHLVSLLFHLLNTLLLFRLLLRMTKQLWPSAFTAALFAIHPLHVESVAWVAERKDVLSTFFGMLTLWAYLRYANAGGGRRKVGGKRLEAVTSNLQPQSSNLKRFSLYLLVLLFFALGLMAKPMLVTLPFLLLLLDYWPLGRVSGFEFRVPSSGIRNPGSGAGDRVSGFKLETRDSRLETRSIRFLILEKLPLIALSLASSVITFIAQQRGGAVSSFERLPLGLRIENALVSYVAYILKTFWPHNLAVLYPHPIQALPLWQVFGSALFLLGVTVAVLRAARNQPYLAVGWLWYLGTLVPVIGIVQVGVQAMADRYTYLPLVGLFIMIAWGVPDLLTGLRRKKTLLAASGGVVLVALAAITSIQIGTWRDSITLFDHALKVTEKNHVARVNLGEALSREGKLDEAIDQFQKALEIKPDDALAYNNLGFVFSKRGKLDEAIDQLHKALEIKPDDASAHNNLGFALAEQGKVDEAIDQFHKALEIQPDYLRARYNLGRVLAERGEVREAIDQYKKVIAIDPDDEAARLNLGLALLSEGRLPEAIDHLSRAVALDPNDPKAHGALGLALARQGKFDEAMNQYDRALSLNPDDAAAHNNFGMALAALGKLAEAAAHFSESLRIKPDPVVHYNLGLIYDKLGRTGEAVREFEAALRINPNFAEARKRLEIANLKKEKR
jgi:tetratricopeptide (TPR) repeat protein